MSKKDEELDWIYECVLQTIRSPEFRNPIKDFIDDNCESFIGLEENTFEQGELHKQFVSLIDGLLDTLTKEFGITEEMFCHAAKKGLNEKKAKKYFEQLISFTNYNYFKNLMTKRNLALEELAYKQMMADKKNPGNEEDMEKKMKELEENELQAALKMSLAAQEEMKKLEEIEDEELQKAIKLSLAEQQASEEPSPIVEMQPTPSKMKQTPPKKEQKKVEPKKMEEIPMEKETEHKMNPVDKVALKQKLLLEHDKKVKMGGQKLSPLPNFSSGNETLNKKLSEFEQNKRKQLQEYREMILKMKKEKRQKEENEADDILKVEDPNASEEDKKRLNLRRQLAEKLKLKNKFGN